MREPSDQPAPQPNRSVAAFVAALLTASGLAAAFGVAACCGLPLMLYALGLGGVSLAGIAFLAAPYRALLLVMATICLSVASLVLWRQRRSGSVCTPDRGRFPRALRFLTMAALIAGVILLALGYAYA